ncbi:MAG: hypothetical protein ACKPE6_09470 [Gammaproteobacteria bacterium]
MLIRPTHAALLALVLALPALAQTSAVGPVIKTGSCPSGYHRSGNYCVPSGSSARATIPKVGSCPSGYHSSGNYCVAN